MTTESNTFPEDQPFSLHINRALEIARYRPVNQVVRPNDKAISARKGLERRGSRSTSTFRGVTHHCRTGRWEAHIWEDGKQVYLGGFDTEEQASVAYDMAALKCRGVTAATNYDLSNYEREIQNLNQVSKTDLIYSLREQSKSTGRRRAGKGRKARCKTSKAKLKNYPSSSEEAEDIEELMSKEDVLERMQIDEVNLPLKKRRSSSRNSKSNKLVAFPEEFDEMEAECSTWKLSTYDAKDNRPSDEADILSKDHSIHSNVSLPQDRPLIIDQTSVKPESNEPSLAKGQFDESVDNEVNELVSMLNFEIPSNELASFDMDLSLPSEEDLDPLWFF